MVDLFSSDLQGISFADVQGFLAIGAPEEQRPSEGLRIDYKLMEPADLADTVAAFANTFGGLIFIGVDSSKKRQNVPLALPGASFPGGDVRARILGRIVAQVTPRAEVDVGVVQPSAGSSNSVVVIRVKEGAWPPYQSAIGDKVRIPLRLQDTNRQATVRDIEQLFNKRASLAEPLEDRLLMFASHPSNPHFSQATAKGETAEPSKAFCVWAIRPRLPLRLRLDRTFDRDLRALISAHFPDTGLGQFFPPALTSWSHTVRWQSSIDSASPDARLRLARHFEFASEGWLRFSERIDRHTEGGRESVSDLFCQGLRFLKLAQDFYRRQNLLGSLSVLHTVRCQTRIRFVSNFPDANGNYHATNAIALAREEMVTDQGDVSMTREVESLETEDPQALVCDFMLGHLRQLWQASVDYQALAEIVRRLELDRPHLWFN